ncbi:MAG: acyltransferase [Kiritimatiellae bacterium]|nr:acyltransferase [Kiritimatiellia bacterium]
MKLTPEISSRIANVSLVAALAVVLLHVGIANGPPEPALSIRVLLRDFSRFAVPFFFLVSGYLLAGHIDDPGWWRREMAKRLKSLLVPYVAWSALFGFYLLVGAAVPEMRQTGAFDINAWWAGKRLTLFGLDPLQVPLMLPFWYLRTLFLLVLASGILVVALRRLGVGILVLLGALYLGYAVAVDWKPQITTHNAFALLRVTLSPEAVFYFSLGLWLRLKEVFPSACRAMPLLAVAFGLIVLRQLVGSWLPYPLIIPIALGGVWCVVPVTPWSKALTGLSFPIYLIHWFFVHLLARTCPTAGMTPASFGLVGVAIVAASAALGFSLRRFMPRFACFLFGGR